MPKYDKDALENQLELCQKNIDNIRMVIAKERAFKEELLGLLYAAEGPDIEKIYDDIRTRDANIVELESGIEVEEHKIQELEELLEEL